MSETPAHTATVLTAMAYPRIRARRTNAVADNTANMPSRMLVTV
jgi:hypothetical protein